ncbi:helix-turn-helix domain-containing protein [Syntrophorhabdus aromaticivorans]|uniref:Helix-turn-helix domain-containing protein n=1 Tax=Syntrophorhabdus aromaticivorans TaxID=328301 RepID=A0A351U401_9BACT|nr:helix-turn-helix domain-containing protein [Syntrophorhabdus aromaticivorans]NLW33968.1 helix-turn-helix domain-containing protein [Syntrophorhabdus aromaticivorans]HBA54682.1 transcriptional regulator [Syntrophorhabdus aromaticivorans]
MYSYHTTEEWEQKIGEQLRRMRLLLGIDQRDLAKRAGIALNAVKNLEGGKGASLKSFIRVLRVVGRIEWLNSLSPEITISPLQIIESRTKSARQRAPRKKRTDHV